MTNKGKRLHLEKKIYKSTLNVKFLMIKYIQVISFGALFLIKVLTGGGIILEGIKLIQIYDFFLNFLR